MKTALCIPVADSFSRVLGVGGAGAGSGVGSLRLQPDRPTSMAAAIELTAMQDLKRELGFCLMSARFGEKVPSPKPGSHMAHAIAMPVLAGRRFSNQRRAGAHFFPSASVNNDRLLRA